MKLSRQAWVSIRAMIVFTAVLGVLYPAVIWVIGLAMPSQSNGSLVRQNGQVVGSSLIGQTFPDKKGKALPECSSRGRRPPARATTGPPPADRTTGPRTR